jgi:hypothetical protein
MRARRMASISRPITVTQICVIKKKAPWVVRGLVLELAWSIVL